jgi:hypothetical protein
VVGFFIRLDPALWEKDMDDTMIAVLGFGQYDAACRDLLKLQEEFGEAVEGYPPLFHQLISPLDKPWAAEKWARFVEANTHASEDWQRFEVLPGGMACGRFFGTSDTSLDSFIRMAERVMECLRRISKMKEGEKVILPDGLELRLPFAQGYQGWMQLLYETARCYPTVLLNAEPGNWGCTGQLTSDDNPAHAFYEEMRHDLFQSSAEAIRLFFATEVEITGDPITDEPPAYLPPEPERNGPHPPNKFWLWGHCYEFSPRPWLLLTFLWGQAEGDVTKEDAMKYIYDADDVEGKFKSLVGHLRTELAEQNCPAEVRTKKEYIWLDGYQPNPASG